MPRSPEQSNRPENEPQPLFERTQLHVSDGAAAIAAELGGSLFLVSLIERHRWGEYGEIPVEDVVTNLHAINEQEGRVFSAYDIAQGVTLYVTTDLELGITTVETPDEYRQRIEQEETLLFPLGRIVATPGALEVLENNGGIAQGHELLYRHQTGDFGDLPEEDIATNHRALRVGARIFSNYILESGEKLYVITEHDRSITTILRPQDY